MMDYRLTLASREEVAAIFALYEARVHWMDEQGLRQWNVTHYLESYPPAYFVRQQRLGALYALKNSAGTVCGAVVFLERDERWPEYLERFDAWYIHNLVTAPETKGAGRALLEQAEAMAAAQGKHFVRLDCASDNTALNEYYESLGYVLAGNCADGAYLGNRREKKLN